MKSDIEIVTGFIGAGKTSFINFLIDETIVTKEKIIIVQCEKGEENLSSSIINNHEIILEFHEPTKCISENHIKNLCKIHRPHRIIIEYNGTKNLNDLLNILTLKSIKKICKISTIYHITDGETFNLYFDNMLSIFTPSIQFSNLILVNNTKNIDKDELKLIKTKLNSLNSEAYIIEIPKANLMKNIILKMNILDRGFPKKLRIFIKHLTGGIK